MINSVKSSIASLFLPLMLGVLMFLTGCVRYDVGIDFAEQHKGAIVQHVQLGEQLTSLSQPEVNQWLDSIEKRAKQLQGKVKRVSSQELLVTIPFSNGRELTDKFNQFFNPNPPKKAQFVSKDNLDLLQLKAEMSLQQSNWLIVEKNSLNLQVDLRALGVLSKQGNIIVSPGSLIDLNLALNTPYGAKNIVNDQALTSLIKSDFDQLVWQLKPGQINQIEAVFWVPSYVGLGTIGIIALMLGGFYLKYRHLPGVA